MGVRCAGKLAKEKCKVFCLNNGKYGVAFSQDREDLGARGGPGDGGKARVLVKQGSFEMLVSQVVTLGGKMDVGVAV